MDEQNSLFTELELREIRFASSNSFLAEMSVTALQDWKERIFKYQTQINGIAPTQQGTLFDLAPTHKDPDCIDPFSLRQQNTEFWRDTFDDEGIAALYFVIDQELPLLLYVGETCKSNQRERSPCRCCYTWVKPANQINAGKESMIAKITYTIMWLLIEFITYQ